MARGFRSVVAGVLVSALVVALSLPSALSQTLAVGTLSGFESPSALASGSYGYNPPVTALQPWTWTQGYGGVGQSGGPFDPPYPNTPNDSPPSPNQYAFMQTSTGTQLTNMSCTLSGLTAGTAYNLTFWYAARSEGYTGNATQSQLTVVLGTQQLWQSPANIQDSSGWTLASAPFTASTATLLQFNVVASSTNDRSILVDSVLVVSIASPLPTAGTVPINTAQAFSFEYPVLTPPTGVSLQSYIYNPQISLSSTAYQPWTFTPSQGGIALTGSPWDPPSPSAPPAGSQYAFLQVSPHSALNDQYSTMTTTVTGLTAGNQYSVSWSSGTRSGYSQTSQLTVSVNGVTLYTSNQNLSDVAGWQYNQSAPFTASGSTCVLQFSVVSLSNSDGAVLIDAVTVGPAFTPTSPYSLTVGTIWGFEGASVGSYAYNPAASVLNPWYWSAGQGGIGTSGSPWDPPYPGTPYDSPPSPNQYAFMQDSGNNTLSNMTAAVTGLLGGLSYTLSFYYAARSEGYTGNTTQSQLTVFFGSQQLWQSPPNIVDPAGWFPVTVQFTPVASSAQLLFAVVAQSANDRSILIDSVLITQTSMPLPTSGSLTQSSLSALSFESPSLLGSSYGPGVSLQNYVYNPQITSSQPWSFSLNQGGIALGGGPWDPLGSNTPPNGLQYAFLQTAPHGAVGDQYCNMSTTVTGLSDGYPYVVSFYWGTRNGYGQNDQLFVTINGQNIYTSALNLVDSTGWIYAQTSSFTLTVSSAVLSFNVVAQYNNDSALLIDAIQFGISQTALPLTTFAVGTPANFESPVIGSYLYNPSLSVLQPWIFTPGAGGIGYSGGPFDPPYPGTPNNDCPSANQYAFIQTGAVIKTSNMTGGLTGITGGSQYILTFYYAARSEGYTGNGTQSQLTVFFAGQQLWQSPPNIDDLSGWWFVNQTFTAPAGVTSGQLTFQVAATSTNDRSIDIDSVYVTPASNPAPSVGLLSTTAGNTFTTATSFESPVLNGAAFGAGVSLQNYAYNPLITPSQPWAFTPFQGGIAYTGSPWDPPAPVAPPAGSQYAFLQTSPHSAANDGTSSMSTMVSGLTGGPYFTISYYWGTRSGYATTSTLTVYVNGQTVYVSNANLSDAGGWKSATTPSFSAPSSPFSLTFTAVSVTNSDGAILLDAISMASTSTPPPTPPSSGGGGSGLSNGAIAGIVIGSVVGAFLLCAILAFCLMSGRSRGDKKVDKPRSSGRFDEVSEQSTNQGETEMATN
jgi:hypothetical protein